MRACGKWLIIVVIFVLCGCSTTKVVEVPHFIKETEQVHHYDSIFMSDSIVKEIKNDTTIIERWHTRTQTKIVIDTITKVDSVTIIQPVETIVEVEVNKIKWWQKTLMWIGVVALAWAVIKIKL